MQQAFIFEGRVIGKSAHGSVLGGCDLMINAGKGGRGSMEEVIDDAQWRVASGCETCRPCLPASTVPPIPARQQLAQPLRIHPTSWIKKHSRCRNMYDALGGSEPSPAYIPKMSRLELEELSSRTGLASPAFRMIASCEIGTDGGMHTRCAVPPSPTTEGTLSLL